MYTATLMFLGQANDRQRDLIAEAEAFHLLSAARRRRRRERAAARRDATAASPSTSTLAPCGSSAAAPAR